jgi:hypothetical protein
MAATAILLDALLAPSTDRVGEVYQRLKSILSTTSMQQPESSLLHRVEASISSPTSAKDGGRKATQGAPKAGTASPLEDFSTCDSPVHLSAQSER